MTPANTSPPRAPWVCWLLVGSFVFALSLAHMAKMAGRGPYPVNGDEGYLAGSAWNMVLSRDPNPHLFNYGSLPIYLTALCQIVGGTLAKWRGEIGQFREVYSVWFPYYTNLSVSYLPRLLFAAFSSASLLLIASLAYRVARRWEALLVAPLILAQSRLFEFHSWAYVNVDILVALLCVAAHLYLAQTYEETSARHRIWFPALFCGCVTATKYNAGLLFLPFVVATLWSPSTHKARKLFGLSAAGVLVFLLCEPFALLDARSFWRDVRHELAHYARGHSGHEAEPGLEQLMYYVQTLCDELSLAVCIVGIGGVLYGLLKQRKLTVLLLLYPLTLLLFMSTKRVHFARNLLAAYALWAPFIALGVVGLSRGASSVAQRVLGVSQAIGPRRAAQLSRAGSLVAIALLALATPLVSNTRALFTSEPDSRLLLAAWAAEHLPHDCVIVAPQQLEIKTETFGGHCRVERFDMTELTETLRLEHILSDWNTHPSAYFVYPTWGAVRDVARRRSYSEAFTNLQPTAPIFEAGHVKIWADRKHVERGDPAIGLYKLPL